MKIKYEKLVRDMIPDLIKQSGRSYAVKVLRDEAYQDALIDKIVEEIGEFRTTRNEEELADLYEVLDCLVESMEYEPMHIDYLRIKKREARGSFKEGYFLVEVEEPDES